MNRKLKISALLLTAALSASILGGCGGRFTVRNSNYLTDSSGLSFSRYGTRSFTEVKPDQKNTALLSGYTYIGENKLLKLYFDDKSAAVAVADKRTGNVEFTNSPDIDKDSSIDADSQNLFHSQLLINYLDGQNMKQIDSYTASVKNKTFSYTATGCNLSVTYRFMDNRVLKEGEKEKQLFQFTMEYSLDQESLLVSVPMSKALYNAKMPPLEVEVLPHFGGSNSTGEGYLFLPDGCGAISEFSSKKSARAKYISDVYGFDQSLNMEEKPAKIQQISMPVFGIKDGDHAFLAIIEDGEAFASVIANRAGTLSSYNEVFASFTTHSYQNITIGSLENASKLIGIQDKAYQGALRIRYSFLSNDEADYSGMAGYYRCYLEKTAGMKQLETKTAIPLNLELLGAVNKVKTLLGIQYQGMESLTTTEQAKEILTEIKKNKISSINLKYGGWFNGGLKQTMASSIKVVSVIGGKSGIANLAEFAAENDIRFYPSAKLLTAPSGSAGFNKFRMAARQIDQKEAKSYDYNVVSRKEDGYRYILTPASLSEQISNFSTNYKNLKLTNLCIEDIAQNVYPDYSKGKPIDRQTTVNIYKSLFKGELSGYHSLMLDGGFSYAVPYADVLLNVPFEASDWYIEDREIPFFQMVYHGYTVYSGEPLNLSCEYEKDLLKVIEYGGVPYFQLMAADGAEVKNTDFSEYCSNNYSIWKDRMIQAWKQINEALQPVGNAKMIKHAKLADDVYQTTYDNGCSVYVNYGTAKFTQKNITVQPGGYFVAKGDAE